MEANDKSKILLQLSRTKGAKSLAALKKQAQGFAETLRAEDDYVVLSQSLSDLQIFAFRIPNETVEICQDFLRRLEAEEIEYKFSGEKIDLADRRSSFTDGMTEDIIGLLSGVRYFAMKDVAHLLFPLTLSERERVAKAARDALRDCAKFDLAVFFGGEHYRGLGAEPQCQLLETLEEHDTDFLLFHREAFLAIVEQLLSPNMEGSDWDYASVTMKFASIPVADDIRDIRQRALALLFDAYAASEQVEVRSGILRTMFGAARRPSHGELTPELSGLIEKNVLDVLSFVRSILPTESLSTVQKIEHDTYWLHYHSPSEAVRASALKVRDTIEENDEYLIYKQLIGFEGVFGEWGAGKDRSDYEKISEMRAAKVIEFAESVDERNWPEWRERIIEFSKTQSNDLATFPNFYDFLERLAVLQPELMLSLLVEQVNDVRGFTIPIYRGLWGGPLQGECKSFLLDEVQKDEQLYAAAKLFLSVEPIDRDVLDCVVERAISSKDVWVLTELIGVACSRFESDRDYTIEGIFRPVLRKLIDLGSTHWIENFWYSRELKGFIADLSEGDRSLVLTSMLDVSDISYRAEEILEPIAQVDPASVIDLFGERIKREKPRLSYSAIPFQLQKLREVLSQHPDLLVDKVRSWYDGSGLFEYTGGKLLAEIYPSLSADFEKRLLNLVEEGSDDDIKFVLAILRNYEGETFLHDLCRAIVARRHGSKEIENLVKIALLSTGVLSGEYGHAEAYERKAEEIRGWLDDPNEGVVLFAAKYIETVQSDAQAERARADEEIALRKHRFGHDTG